MTIEDITRIPHTSDELAQLVRELVDHLCKDGWYLAHHRRGTISLRNCQKTAVGDALVETTKTIWLK